MRKSLVSTLKGEKSDKIPIWYMRQAGRYLPEYQKLRQRESNFIRFCLTPELSVEASLQPLRRFDLDAAILFSDILLIPHLLGQHVCFEKGIGPVLAPFSLSALDKSKLSGLSPVYEAIAELKRVLASDKALIGFSGAAWTLACYMIAGRSDPLQEKARFFSLQHKQQFSELIEILIDSISAHLIAQLAAGAEIVQIFDSWAGVLSAAQFESHVIRPTAEIVRKVRAAHPKALVIGFARQAGVLSEAYARDTGIDAISVDSTLPLGWIARKLQPHIAVQGNLDPLLARTGGQAMLSAAEDILAHLGGGNFIFGLGHGILPATPAAHILELTRFIRAWQR